MKIHSNEDGTFSLVLSRESFVKLETTFAEPNTGDNRAAAMRELYYELDAAFRTK
jgi:hypothetical protein